MSLFKERSSISHWSVDFVEHVRTVHFALVTVSVALIILVSGSSHTRYSRALTQAQQIMALSDRWTDVQNVLYFAAVRARNTFPLKPYILEISDPRVDRRRIVEIHVTPDALNQYQPWKFSSNIKMQGPPQTLAAFRIWWTALHSGQASARVPYFQDSGPVTCTAQNAQGGESESEYRWVFEKETNDFTRLLPCKIAGSRAPNTISASAVNVGTPFSDDTPYVVAKANRIWTYDLSGMPLTSNVHLALNVKFVTVPIDESRLRLIYEDWSVGQPYFVAFEELAEVSKDIDDIDIKGVPTRLLDMRPKDQDLEVFGLKIPAIGIALWGMVLILATQFYFWLHLHELNRKIDPSSPGWDVAWVGVYQSLSSKVVMVASACMLPVISLGILARRIPEDLHSRFTGRLMAIAGFVLGILFASIAAERLYLLWQIPRSEVAVPDDPV